MNDNLLRLRFQKYKFDPTNKQDMLRYKQFTKTGSWGNGGCPYLLEWPWLTIPAMIAHKISEHTLEQMQ